MAVADCLLMHASTPLRCFGAIVHPVSNDDMIKVLKFQTLSSCLLKRPTLKHHSLIKVFPVCYSDKHFVNSSPENQHFVESAF